MDICGDFDVDLVRFASKQQALPARQSDLPKADYRLAASAGEKMGQRQ